MNEARIRTLEALLAHATVVEPPEGDKVGTGSRVSFRDKASGATTDLTLVHRLEADSAEGKVSVESPIARALLGRRAGEVVKVTTPGGQKQLEIVSVA